MNICLSKTTHDLMHSFSKSFVYDLLTIPDNENVSIYLYNQENVDQLYDKLIRQGKLHFAIMYAEQIIGDIYLKQIASVVKTCETGIHMINDNHIGKGYGTQVEKILLQHAFANLNIKNSICRYDDQEQQKHACTEKLGFTEIRIIDQMARFEYQKST